MPETIPQQVNAQRAFYNSGKTRDLKFLKGVLARLEKEIILQEDAICDALYSDFKKPRLETLMAETQFVLAELKNLRKHLKLWSRPERVSGSVLNFPASNWIYREPYGKVLIIAPWNYPFQLAILPLVSAIAAGNTVVIKPSEITPNTSAIIKKLINAVFDPGHATVIEGGIEISEQLLAQRWDYIFFTGSTNVGRIVYESAAKNLTPVTLELGGKSPCIVDETCNLAQASKRIVWGKFLNAGQTCIAPDYVLVHNSVKAAFIKELSKTITSFYGSDPEQSGDLARIVSKNHFNRLKGLLEEQKIIVGGQFNENDNYLSPTLIDDPEKDSKVMQEEIFGPILPVIGYQNEEEIASWVNSYGKPLATYVFSKRKSFQDRLLNQFSFGGGVINDTLLQFSNKELPFGGIGESGLSAYHGKKSFDIFSHQKSIVKRGTWIDLPFRNPPYTLPISLVKRIKHFL